MKNLKLSPRNARALRLMAQSGVLIGMSERGWSGPGFEGGDQSARIVGREIGLTRDNVFKMQRDGLIERVEEQVEEWMPWRFQISPAGRLLLSSLKEEAFQPKAPDLSADQIKKILQGWYQAEGWLFFTEFQIDGRRMDAYSLGWLGSEKWIAQAFEIKVARGDLVSDIRLPEKRQPAMANAHQFFYVTPQKLASPSEIPEDCGLIELWKDGSRHIIVDAPLREISNPSWRLLALVVYKALRAYHRRYDYASGEMVGEDRPIPPISPEQA